VRSTLAERYRDDPVFHSLVDMMSAAIEQGQFTPMEAREAAMFAQLLYEDRHPRRTTFTLNDVMTGKV
jgi:hypothetical protein